MQARPNLSQMVPLGTGEPPDSEESVLGKDDSDNIPRMISNISNDSIRQLLKIASIGVDEEFKLDDYDLSDICESWDVPLPAVEEMPMDLQMEVDAMRQQLRQYQDLPPDYPEMPQPQYPEEMKQEPPPPQMFDPYMKPSYDLPPEAMAMDMKQGRGGYEGMSLMGMDQGRTPHEMDVQHPHVNLVLDSNAVKLDSRFCPKPSVTILPGHVIHAPNMHSPTHAMYSSQNMHDGMVSRQMGGNRSIQTEAPYRSGMPLNMDPSWSMPQQHQHRHPYPPEQQTMYHQMHPPPMNYDEDFHNAYMNQVNGEFSQMMVDDPEVNPFTVARQVGMNTGMPFSSVEESTSVDVSMPVEREERPGKVVRKNTAGEKFEQREMAGGVHDTMEEEKAIGSSQKEDALALFSRSTELSKVEHMSESELCDYVKSVAPQLQNNAMEEIVKETNFEQRLQKAEQKMQEHIHEMDRIQQEIRQGTLDHKSGQEMLRKAYNRREAASTRTKREKGLVHAAIKKRTLEKICNWMRERLIGTSELFRTTSSDAVVRRTRSDGTRVCK